LISKGGSRMDFSWLKENKKIYYLTIIGILAFIFLLISSLGNSGKNNDQANYLIPDSKVETNSKLTSFVDDYSEDLEKRLSSTLKEINRVGEVTVMIKYFSSPEMIYAYNTTKENKVTEEKDTAGGNRTINEQRDANELVIIQNSSSTSNQPVIVKRVEPEISGVLVVAEGAEIAAVRAQLVKAVQTVLNIPSYRINVLPKGR